MGLFFRQCLRRSTINQASFYFSLYELKNEQKSANSGKNRGSSLALLVSLSLGQQASAVTLVENLSQSSNGSGSVLEDAWSGSSFTTGSGSYNLESVTLLFRENIAGNLFVRLYGNNGGVPGSLITTFTNPASITTNLANNTQPLPYRHRGVRGERDSRKLDLVTLKFDELIAMIE